MNNDYIHKIDKSSIPTCNILGVNIAAIDMEWLLEFTKKNIKDLSGDYMCVANVHTTISAYEDAAYKSIQNNGIMAIPDGGPLSSVGRKRGYKKMDRIAGPSYMIEILKLSAQMGYHHYFYGSTLETLTKINKNLKRYYPGVKVVGMYSPPFRDLTEIEDKDIIENINSSKPDFVWVGLGAPKQERWMADHQGKINGFMVGIGAGFDYLSGNIKRSPKWMQKSNLEWLYRLIQEPKRLFKRYWNTNTKFIWNVLIKGK